MRSIALLVSNILATLYSAFLLLTFGGAIIEAGGADFVNAVGAYFELIFNVLGINSPEITVLYVILILLCVHIAVFAIGCLVGWIAYACKKSGAAKFAAVLYLLGTICFPIYILFSLPITIIGFIGGGKQKKLNNA